MLHHRMPPSPRTRIQQNRSISLFFLYLLFLIGMDPALLGVDPEGAVCMTFAVAIHFFGLAMFSWTAIEG